MKFRLLAIAATAMFYGACVEGAEPVKDTLSDVAGPETGPEPDDGPELDVALDLVAQELPGPDVVPSSCEQKCEGRGTCADFQADNVQACKWRCQIDAVVTQACLDSHAPCKEVAFTSLCDIGQYSCADECAFVAQCFGPGDKCVESCEQAAPPARNEFVNCSIGDGNVDCTVSQDCLQALKSSAN